MPRVRTVPPCYLGGLPFVELVRQSTYSPLPEFNCDVLRVGKPIAVFGSEAARRVRLHDGFVWVDGDKSDQIVGHVTSGTPHCFRAGPSAQFLSEPWEYPYQRHRFCRLWICPS